MKIPYNKNLKELAKTQRHSGNLSEVLLWNILKNRQLLNIRFIRQKVIGNFIVDFYCPEYKIAIEIDGYSHDLKGEYNEQREAYLTSMGIKILHFLDSDIKNKITEISLFLEQYFSSLVNQNSHL